MVRDAGKGRLSHGPENRHAEEDQKKKRATTTSWRRTKQEGCDVGRRSSALARGATLFANAGDAVRPMLVRPARRAGKAAGRQ
ncbi:hypothetical protein MTO96_002706 [Rhipicephalus appendiculatus]